MVRIILTAGLCCSAVALAQTPDEEWGDFPADSNGAGKPPAKVPQVAPPRPPEPEPVGSAPRAGLGATTRPPEQPNTVSMFGGPTLGQWKRGQAIFLGFPLLGLKLAIGLHDRLDFFIGFESFYFVMNEFHAGFKVGILRKAKWSMAASIDGTFALFAQRARNEIRGPRWITGHRNWGLSPGLIVSYQGDSPRAARLFLEARYLLAFDTDPFAKVPLNGVPSGLVLGHNAQLRLGAEMPLSARTSFVFLLGLDIHGRPDDAIVMPVASLGLVTGI